jgi:hypothetical protein
LKSSQLQGEGYVTEPRCGEEVGVGTADALDLPGVEGRPFLNKPANWQ